VYAVSERNSNLEITLKFICIRKAAEWAVCRVVADFCGATVGTRPGIVTKYIRNL
jgi:hypothetical protein